MLMIDIVVNFYVTILKFLFPTRLQIDKNRCNILRSYITNQLSIFSKWTNHQHDDTLTEVDIFDSS